MRHHGAAGKPDAIDIDALHLGEFLVGYFIDRSANIDAGTVDKDINPTKLLQTRSCHGLHFSLLGNIRSEASDFAVVFAGQFLSSGFGLITVTANQHEGGTRTGKARAHGFAKPLGSAGDNCDAISQVE